MNNGVTFAKIGISNIDSNVLWVFTVNGTCSGTCMFRTTDAGGSWNSQQIDIFPFGDNAILPDPRSILSAWADAVNLKRTTDGNTSWQTIFASYSFRALGMLGTGRLFGATSGLVGAASVQWSFDDGSTWFSIGDPAMVGVSSSMNPPLSAAGYGGGLVPFVPAKNQLPKNPLYP
jgi:hypothetical protein